MLQQKICQTCKRPISIDQVYLGFHTRCLECSAGSPGQGKPATGGGGLPVIRRGSTGSSVSYCQNLLNARIPVQPLWVDGIFGPLTDTRVRQFQASKGLVVDGIVGPMTWAALEAGPPPIKKRG